MQLVEQAKIGLDDADAVEKIAPELRDMKILKGFDGNDRPILVEKKNRITLRHLLSHTGELVSKEIWRGVILTICSRFWIHILQSGNQEVWIPSWN